jgi:hypothetical protein
MKIILLICCVISLTAFSQVKKGVDAKIIKSGKITQSDGANYYFENDREGNSIFSKNVGMNGPITMISVREYDSLGRQIRSFSVHSNLGFSLNETEYVGNQVFYYKYISAKADEHPSDQKSLENINSQKQFLALPVVQELKSGDRVLKQIETYNADSTEMTNYYIAEAGDTSSINVTEFDSLGRQTVYHYGRDNTDSWNWDIYYTYDKAQNMYQNVRVSKPNSDADTTELRRSFYNDQDRLISRDYYRKGHFEDRTVYEYNDNKLAVELYYSDDEDEVKTSVRFFQISTEVLKTVRF